MAKQTIFFGTFTRRVLLLCIFAFPVISGSGSSSILPVPQTGISPEGMNTATTGGAFWENRSRTHTHIHSGNDEIHFEEEVIYSEPLDVMFGNIVTSAVDRSNRVLMGDNDQKKVHVLDSDGNYLQSFGSQGNGPGEFQMITKIAANDDHIHVFDMIMSRINIFDANSFDFIRTVTLSEDGGAIRRGATDNSGLGRPIDFHLLTDGNYLVSFRTMMGTSQRQTAIISTRGEILEKNRFDFRTGADEITESSSGNMRVIMNLPSNRSTELTISAGGVLFVNWSEHLEFDLYDEDGNHIRTFSHPYRNASMDRSELLKMFEARQGQGVVMGAGAGGAGGGGGGGFPAMEQMLQNMELPDTWPAVQSMYADPQNRLWVSAFTAKADERQWFLFDESGSLLGTFTWPSYKRVVHADQNSVYVLNRPDDDLDTVIRYGFTGG